MLAVGFLNLLMKPAFQKDSAFLADVRRTLNAETSRLWWLGQSGFLIAKNGRALLLDPYLSESLTHKYANSDKPHTRITERVIAPGELGRIGVIDCITSSHNHTDHLDAETLSPLLETNPQARLVIPKANHDFVLQRLGSTIAPKLVQVDHGLSVHLSDLEIHGIASAHPTIERNSSAQCHFLGYVLLWGGFTLYHSGDTLWHDGLVSSLKPFAIDIALLPINGDRPERRVAGNLDGRQAAQLAKAIGARLVIPCHFDLFEFNTANPDEFIAECRRIGQSFEILQNGQGFDLHPV